MRVVVTHHFTDDLCRLHCSVRSAPTVLIHRIQNTTINRLQPVTNVRQSTVNNNRHRVFKEGIFHNALNCRFFNTANFWLFVQNFWFYYIFIVIVRHISSLKVQIFHINLSGICLNKIFPQFYAITHKLRKYRVCPFCVFNINLH